MHPFSHAALLQKAAVASEASALAHEPHGGPERGRGARPGRQAAPFLERLRHVEGAQPAARDENRIGVRRLLARLGGEFDNFILALADSTAAELRNAEALKRAHVKAVVGEEILE